MLLSSDSTSRVPIATYMADLEHNINTTGSLNDASFPYFPQTLHVDVYSILSLSCYFAKNLYFVQTESMVTSSKFVCTTTWPVT